MDMNYGGGRWEGGGWAGWSGVGGEWDNCNSIINKYIKKKKKSLFIHSFPLNLGSASDCFDRWNWKEVTSGFLSPGNHLQCLEPPGKMSECPCCGTRLLGEVLEDVVTWRAAT